MFWCLSDILLTFHAGEQRQVDLKVFHQRGVVSVFNEVVSMLCSIVIPDAAILVFLWQASCVSVFDCHQTTTSVIGCLLTRVTECCWGHMKTHFSSHSDEHAILTWMSHAKHTKGKRCTQTCAHLSQRSTGVPEGCCLSDVSIV